MPRCCCTALVGAARHSTARLPKRWATQALRAGDAANAGALELTLERSHADVDLQGHRFNRAAASVCCFPAGLLSELCSISISLQGVSLLCGSSAGNLEPTFILTAGGSLVNVNFFGFGVATDTDHPRERWATTGLTQGEFAEGKHCSCSERDTYSSTIEVLRGLQASLL
jgi:hypothetical protein